MALNKHLDQANAKHSDQTTTQHLDQSRPSPYEKREDSDPVLDSDSLEPLPREYFVRKGTTMRKADEQILEKIWRTLMKEQQVDLSELEVDVKDDRVFLTGTVSDSKIRAHVEDFVSDIDGVTEVVNELHVLKKIEDLQTRASYDTSR